MNGTGWPLRCALTCLAALALPRLAEAQSVGSTEPEIARVFAKLGYRFDKAGTEDDGLPFRRYKRSKGVGYIEVEGPSTALVWAAILVPWAELQHGTNIELASFMLLVCAHDLCDGNGAAVSAWADENAGKEDVDLTRRFGKIEFRLGVGTADLPGVALTADARPAYREAQARAQAEEAERLAREQQQVRQQAATKSLQAAVDHLSADAPTENVLALLARVDGDPDALGTEKLSLHVRLVKQLVRAYVRDGEAQLHAGRIDAAARTSFAADQLVAANSAVLGTATDVEHLRALVFVAEGEQQERQQNWMGARSLFIRASNVEDDPAARLGIDRISSHQRSPSLAVALSIVPGGGQFYAHHPVRGVLFPLGVGAGVVTSVIEFMAASSSYRTYQAATTPADATAAYGAVEQNMSIGLVALGVGVAVYVWNLIDAAHGAKEWNRDRLGID
ncbi:MAG TPA: hypothetical protein VGH28_02115 [Polyangiaceae bacterium]|jgi:hypothetical protein